MYGVDQFLIAGTIASVFWLLATQFLQKKWLIYTLFVGKKHALSVHSVVLTFVALQQFALSVWNFESRWMFTTSLWMLGALIFAASLTLFTATLTESGGGILVGASVFSGRKAHRGALWKRYKQPLALSIAGTYVGLALLTGHIVYLIVAVLLGGAFWLTDRFTR